MQNPANATSPNLINGRDGGIETLRGIAIILMVAGHVIGRDQSTGLKVEDDTWLRYFYYLFEYLRMPLFTVISGFVYAMKPIGVKNNQQKFLNRKVSRLLIPFFFAVTFLVIFQIVIPGTNAELALADVWKVYLFSYAQFWFVQGMFVVFLLIAGLEVLQVMHRFRGWLLLFLLSIAVFYLDPIHTSFFSLNRVPFLFMFFCLGLGMRRFYSEIFQTKAVIYTIVVLFISVFIYQQYLYFYRHALIDLEETIKLLTIVVGTTGACALVKGRFYQASLAWIGNFSYEIFLYHSFGTAGCRIFLKVLGVNNLTIYFIACLMLGIIAPIIFRLTCDRIYPIGVILFGDRWKSRLRTEKPTVLLSK